MNAKKIAEDVIKSVNERSLLSDPWPDKIVELAKAHLNLLTNQKYYVYVPVKKLLELRDELVQEDIDEAYHILYGLADPNQDQFEPWKEWESMIK